MYEQNLMGKRDNYMLQVGSSSLRNSNVCSWSVDLVECGSKMQIMTYAGERANFRHSFTLGK